MLEEANRQGGRVLGLIPAYDEALTITRVVTEALTYVPVLVVDDGSSDDTSILAQRAGATILRQTPNQGKGAALKTGFRSAVDQGYDAIITLDADGQHDPSEIPKFLAAYAQRQADLIIGARDFVRMPFVRRLANTLGRVTFSWALRQHIRDNQSGYRLISRRLAQVMLSNPEQGFEFEVEMIVTCVQNGFLLDWVPIRTIYSGEKSHIHGRRHLVNFIRMSWRTRQRTRKRS